MVVPTGDPTPLTIWVGNYASVRAYVQAARLNGRPLGRKWLTHATAAALPAETARDGRAPMIEASSPPLPAPVRLPRFAAPQPRPSAPYPGPPRRKLAAISQRVTPGAEP